MAEIKVNYEEVKSRLQVKLAKYSIEDIDDELTAMLYDEAMKEVTCARYINSGRGLAIVSK